MKFTSGHGHDSPYENCECEIIFDYVTMALTKKMSHHATLFNFLAVFQDLYNI